MEVIHSPGATRIIRIPLNFYSHLSQQVFKNRVLFPIEYIIHPIYECS